MAKQWQTDLRKLGQRKWRLHHGQAVLEGIRLVRSAVEHNVPLLGSWYSPDLRDRPGGEQLLHSLWKAGVAPVEVRADELNRVADVKTSQGIVATMNIVPAALPEQGDLWMIVDGVQDPGNLGTMLRSAAAAGAAAVFLLPGTADLYNPKTLRAAMGAAFQLPIIAVNSFQDQVLPYLAAHQAGIVVADIAGQFLPGEVDLVQPVALVLGNEGWGPSELVKSHAQHSVCIPMPGGAESLNVAMAATVLLYEVVRQRNQLVC